MIDSFVRQCCPLTTTRCRCLSNTLVISALEPIPEAWPLFNLIMDFNRVPIEISIRDNILLLSEVIV